jgi:DnaA family protein
MSQLALPLQLADHAVFASFFDRGNESLVSTLAGIAAGDGGHGCWIWGSPASGKTHLLQAVCDAAGDRSIYVPLSVFSGSGAEILDGLANRDLICIDDVDDVASDSGWESALFDLCNQILDAGSQMLVAASTAPRESAFELADLRSRFAKLPVFQIHTLAEEERVAALQMRSRHRGLELPEETAQYLLKRCRRDMASLYGLLDTLDKEALRAQRRLTIPFVRSVISGDRDDV